MRTLAACLLLGLASLAACGKDNGLLPPGGDAGAPPFGKCTTMAVVATEPGSFVSDSQNFDPTCETSLDAVPWKNAAAGSACASPADCTPACVACPNNTHLSLASWCDHGRCAARDEIACMVLGTPGLPSCSTIF